MAEPETGNQAATPAPEPAPPAVPTASPRPSEAVKASQRREAVERAMAAQARPAPEAPPEPGKDETAEPPRFFSKKPDGKPAPFDPAKLPPELQETYRSMQADATQKWQAAADLKKQAEEMRERLDTERQTLMETLRDAVKLRQGPEAAPAPEQDVIAQIQSLRDEGRHAEADALLRDAISKEAAAAVAPLKKEAELNLLKTAFRDTSSDVVMNNPVVARYKDDVVKVFDGDSPIMQAIRPYLLQNEASIRTLVPLALNAIATEIHARSLEESFDKAVEAKVAKVLEERRSTAGRVPARLVESGGSTKTGGPAKMSLKESFDLARETNTSGHQ